LNISGVENESVGADASGPSETPASAPASRETLISELVEQMTSWSPRERMSAFRSWLKGSLSLIHLHVLTVLEADGPLAMSKLAETLDVSVASATGIVSRMEERQLVEREHDREDRRVVLVIPTETGAAVFRTMTEHRRDQLRLLLGRLTDPELSALLTGLRAVGVAREALHAEHQTAAAAAETTDPATPAATSTEAPVSEGERNG